MGQGPDPLGATPSSRDGRTLAFTVLTFLFGVGALGGLFGIGIVIGWFDNDQAGIHRVHELGFGVLYGIVVATAFFAMVRRPATKPSVFLQVVAVVPAVAIAAMLSADPGYLTIAGALLAASGILLALHPDRRGILHPNREFSAVMGAFVLFAAIPLVSFAMTAARLQRDGSPLDPHVNMEHWTTMASMALGLVAVGLLASARIPGWRLTAWCAGLAVATYGLGSIVFRRFPGTDVPYPGSAGLGWGWAAVIGGLVFILIAEWEIRRS